MRDLKKKDKLVEAAGDAYGKTLTLLPLDVCSDESVKQCINNVKDRHIDILSEWDTPETKPASPICHLLLFILCMWMCIHMFLPFNIYIYIHFFFLEPLIIFLLYNLK